MLDLVKLFICDDCAWNCGFQIKYPKDSGNKSWLCGRCKHYGIGNYMMCEDLGPGFRAKPKKYVARKVPSKLILAASIETRDNCEFLNLCWNNLDYRRVYRILYDGDVAELEGYTFHGDKSECVEIKEAAKLLKNKARGLVVDYYRVDESYTEPYLFLIKDLL